MDIQIQRKIIQIEKFEQVKKISITSWIIRNKEQKKRKMSCPARGDILRLGVSLRNRDMNQISIQDYEFDYI